MIPWVAIFHHNICLEVKLDHGVAHKSDPHPMEKVPELRYDRMDWTGHIRVP